VSDSSPKFIIREATPDDAAQVIAFMKTIADERDNGTSFSSADEFMFTLEQEQDVLRYHAEADNAIWLVAEADGQIIANANAGGGKRGAYGNLSLGITVDKAWRNHGVGTALMQHLIEWCRANPVVFRLHLMVFNNNPRAIHVYEKLGFQHEGTWRSAYLKHGEYLDLVQMAILFERVNYQLPQG
jgi:RimJ/RimL family protein N-acetyltransferase